ncbi:MAG TPA: T9SS type A sorting domain-containing protein [Bacteroidia bacterium]|nr:T9SS type A sorting domain-containing protein [Bacteroidia bacterium]
MKLIIALLLTLSLFSLKSQWTPVNSEPGLHEYYTVQHMNMQDSAVLFYAGKNGGSNFSQGIFYSNDDGENFKYYADLTSAWGTIYYLRFLKGDTLLIVTSKGILKQSPNKSDLPEFIIEFAPDPLYPNGYSALTIFWGDSGIVNSKFSYKTYDSGNTWKKVNDTPHKYYGGTKLVYRPSSGRMITHSQYYINESTDYGRTWTLLYDFFKVTNDPIKNIFDISFINDSLGFFSTVKSIYRTTDGGKTWDQNNYINFSLGDDVSSLKYFDTSTGYIIVSRDNDIYKTNDGKTWAKEFTFNKEFSINDKFYYFNDSMFFVSNGTSLYKRSRLSLGAKKPSHEAGVKPQITVYPNPARDQIIISLPENIEAFYYDIFDLQGRMIITGKAESRETTISLQGLQPGLYVLNVRAGGFITQSKIIKQ